MKSFLHFFKAFHIRLHVIEHPLMVDSHGIPVENPMGLQWKIVALLDIHADLWESPTRGHEASLGYLEMPWSPVQIPLPATTFHWSMVCHDELASHKPLQMLCSGLTTPPAALPCVSWLLKGAVIPNQSVLDRLIPLKFTYSNH